MAYDTVKIKLPSNGYAGYDPDLEIRNLTGADEKIIYSGASEVNVDKLLKRCIVSPDNVDLEKMWEVDKYFILLKIRQLTYGDDYVFATKCPDCGKKFSVECNLGDLNVSYMTEDIMKLLEIELPVSKKKLKLRMLTSSVTTEVNNRAVRLKVDKGTKYLMRCGSLIETVDGEDMSIAEKTTLLEELNSRDINHIWKAYSKLDCGVDMTLITTCPNCGEDEHVRVEMNQEFFRPSTDY